MKVDIMFIEDDYLQLSGIQHFAFCPRQWALIHIEQQWNESYLTVSGSILHAKTHNSGGAERRGDIIVFRTLKVASSKLGVSGECDVVEFHKSVVGIALHGYEGLWLPFPVEYKRGKLKLDDCDRLQLCAQVVCLEEMLCTRIENGALFYGEPRRREVVSMTEQLREKLFDTVNEMHKLYRQKHTPKAAKAKRCGSCSMKDMCLPKLGTDADTSVKDYMEAHL